MGAMRLFLLTAVCVVLPRWASGHGGANGVSCTWDTCSAPCGGGTRTCVRSNGKRWRHPCHVQDCQTPAGCGRADLVFVLDSSASIGDKNYWMLKQWTVDLMRGLGAVSPRDSRVAAVIYSDNAQKQWGLRDGTDAAWLEKRLWSLPWMASTTNTYEGLQQAWDIIRGQARGDVKHIVIVVTDGKSNLNADKVLPTAAAMHKSGIEIFTLGIGKDIDEAECAGISSARTADHYFPVERGYPQLASITNNIIQTVCAAASKTVCEDWSDWGACSVENKLETDEDIEGCTISRKLRSRSCKFYLWDGAEPEVREARESQECSRECKTDNDATDNDGDGDDKTDFEKCLAKCQIYKKDETNEKGRKDEL